MKRRVTRRIIFASFMVLIPVFVFLLPRAFPPEGSVLLRDIISYCVGNAESDGIFELLAISGSGETDAGERHGEFLLVCDATAREDMDSLGYIPPGKIRYRIDLSEIKPLKVQLSDVNGDGINEISVCVYKTAKFHPVMAKRPFFFDLVEGNLIPVWLGSRLSRPFDDYTLHDIDSDVIDEIVSVEQLENGKRVVAVYNWRGFGFEMIAQSEGFDGNLILDPDTAGQAENGEICAVISDGDEQIQLCFRLTGDRLIYRKN